MGFADDVRRFVDKADDKMTRAIRKIAIDAFSEVILKTPVDTGRARGNWQVAIGELPTGTIELDDKSGQIAIGKVQAEAMGVKAGDVIYLANSLPYIQALEDGSSTQAPAGMVKLTAQRFQIIADKVIAQIGRE